MNGSYFELSFKIILKGTTYDFMTHLIFRTLLLGKERIMSGLVSFDVMGH